MAKKRKTLPKNFKELIKENNIEELKNIFDSCELDARGGYGKTTALSFYKVPDELVRWLVENGADIEAKDPYGFTALHIRSRMLNGDITNLLELGANVKAIDRFGDTPLHLAAGVSFSSASVKKLIEYGAEINALNVNKQTPLEKALSRANNSLIKQLAEISEALLQRETEITQKMKEEITRIGKDFESQHKKFNQKDRIEIEKALTKLYEMYKVQPIRRLIKHDGVSPIIVSETSLLKQFHELWELLVPSSGSAKTVQGEVVRIAGKVRDEINRNGGCNWNIQFKKILNAFLLHLNTNNASSVDELEKVNLLVHDIIKSGDAETDELNYLCEIATKWVVKNANPILLKKPSYKI